MQSPRAHRTTELISELARQGHSVTLYCVLGDFDYTDFKSKTGIKIFNIPSFFQLRPYTSDGISNRTIVDKILSRVLGRILEFPHVDFILSIPAIVSSFSPKQFDLAISIAVPHQIHWGCAIAKRKFSDRYPQRWIADCGDPFMNNNKTKDHFKYFSFLERFFCKSCDFITVPIEEAKEGYYAEFRHKIHVIPQGFNFDITVTDSQKTLVKNEVPTFLYAGVFIKDIRNPAKIFDYLSNCKDDFKLIVYTPNSELIDPYRSKLGDRLEVRKPINRTELLSVMKTMDFVLNIENANTRTASPSKLIDYAISGRPILSINPNTPDTNAINEFLNLNFRNQLIVKNLEQYHISNVAKRFVDLAQLDKNST